MLDKLLSNVSEQVGTYLPGILSAVAVLVIGWIVAHLIARVVRMAMKKTGMGAKLSNMVSSGGGIDAGAILAKVVYYMIMLFVLITFFNVLNLPVVSEPLNAFLSKIFGFAPRVLSAGILGIVAYVLARVSREAAKRGLESIDIDTKLANLGGDINSVTSAVSNVAESGLATGQLSPPTQPMQQTPQMELADDDLDFSDDFDQLGEIGDPAPIAPPQSARPSRPSGGEMTGSATGADSESVKLSQTLPEAIYWVIFALFLPAILGALQMPGLLEPVQSMFTKAFDYLPNLIGAGVILLVGFFVAKIVRQVVSNLTASLGVDQMANKYGLGSPTGPKVSGILGVVTYAMVLLPVVVASLNTLDIKAVTEPAGQILTQLTSLIPGFIGAAVVLGIAFFVGKIVSEIVGDLLSGVGFDSIPNKIGLNLANTSTTLSPSKLASKGVLISIVLLSAMQALPMMGLESLSGHLEKFAGFGVQVLLGLVILAAGMYLANFVAKLVRDSGIENGDKLALVARVAILLFAGGFGLQQMGLSASIVNVAFGSILGGLGLAAAIAFGWGGRDAAKRILDRVVK